MSEQLNEIDYAALKDAVALLENPNWTIKLANIIGVPLEWAMGRLPQKARIRIDKAVKVSISGALRVAVYKMDMNYRGKPYNWTHRASVILTGMGGGFFGVLGTIIELPISTTIMLRSIADIARSEGERLDDIQTQLACVEVFALGGNSKKDDATETSYYAIRSSLASATKEAAAYIANNGLQKVADSISKKNAIPVINKFVTAIAQRFEITVSEKVAGQIIPGLGALAGAAINLLFINHFQNMAKGHFVVRRLERKYGEELVRAKYEEIRRVLEKNKKLGK